MIDFKGQSAIPERESPSFYLCGYPSAKYMSAKSIPLVLSVIALALLSLAYRSQKLHANKLEQQVSALQREQAKQMESSDAQVTLLRTQLGRQQSLVQELAQLRGISASYRHITNEFARLQKEHGQLVDAVKEQASTYATLMNQRNGNTEITSEPDLSYLPAGIKPIVTGHSSGRFSMEAIAERVRLGATDEEIRRQFGIGAKHPEIDAILDPESFRNVVPPVAE